jgi:ABC-type multidrug transport system ATPase subunit
MEILTVENLSKNYGNIKALKNVSFLFHPVLFLEYLGLTEAVKLPYWV